MPAKGQFKLSSTDEADIVRRYLAKEPHAKIAADYGIHLCTVNQIARRTGKQFQTLSEAARRHTLNDAAFDAVTEESAYWVGFLMGDGSIAPRRYAPIIQLGLAEEDRGQVEAFRAFLGSSHPIYTRESKSSYANCQRNVTVGIPSTRLVAALARFGVLPRKTHTAKVVGLEDDRHFWRGVVDADGSLFFATARYVQQQQNGNVHRYCYHRPVLSLAGAKPLMEQFAEFVKRVVQAKASVRPHCSIWNVRVSGVAARDLTKHLYGDCTVGLARKLVTAREVMKYQAVPLGRKAGQTSRFRIMTSETSRPHSRQGQSKSSGTRASARPQAGPNH